MLSQIIKMVSDAAATKAPIARIADAVSAVFVPAVIGVAVLVMIVWILLGAPVAKALEYAICVLVISCPCALVISIPLSFFAGIGGGLAALNFEIVTAEVVSAHRSGAYLLFVFLGGAIFFFGPILGAILMVIALVLLSELTMAWLLYLGLVFLFMVMYAPGGVASLIMMNLRLAKFGKLRQLWTSYLALGGTALVGVMGAACMIEMTYHLQLNAALGPELTFLGATLNAKGFTSWFGAVFVMVTGFALFELCRRQFVRQWSRIQEEIEHEIKRGEAL